VNEAADRIDPDPDEAEGPRVLGDLRVGRTGNDEVDRSTFPVIGLGAPTRRPVARDDADLSGIEVTLQLVNEVDESRIDRMRIAGLRIAQSYRGAIEIAGREPSAVACGADFDAIAGVERAQCEERATRVID